MPHYLVTAYKKHENLPLKYCPLFIYFLILYMFAQWYQCEYKQNFIRRLIPTVAEGYFTKLELHIVIIAQ